MSPCISSPRPLRVASTPSLHVAAPPSPPGSTTAYHAPWESLLSSSNVSTHQPFAVNEAQEPSSQSPNGSQRSRRLLSLYGYDSKHLPIPCLGPKRVEDVKLNRIDKCRSSRRRKNFSRPFVFKSSPLAEGQSARKLNVAIGNPFARFSKIGTLPENTPSQGNMLQLTGPPPGRYRNNGLVDPMPSTPLRATSVCKSSPPAFEAFSASPPLISPFATRAALSGRQRPPQIARSHTASQLSKHMPILSHTSTSEHQTWEIALPKCILLNFGPQT